MADAVFETILVERHDRVLKLILNRPETLNSVNHQMTEDLMSAFRWASEDEESNVIVLTGAGKGFCSGGDVGGMASSPSGTNTPLKPGQVHHVGRHLVDVMLWVEKPMIAMVNGAAVGLGATLALLCDIVTMADHGKIGDRHVNVGLVAGDGGAAIWPLLVGVNMAKELLMTGRLLSAAEAKEIGLVNRVVPREDLESVTMALAHEIAAQPAFAVRATKVSVNRVVRSQIENVLDVSFALESLSLGSDEQKKATQAFMASRR